MTDKILGIEKLELKENDVIVVTVSNSTNPQEATSILTNLRNQVRKNKMKNIVIITTPNIRLSTLTDDDLDQIGLKRK